MDTTDNIRRLADNHEATATNNLKAATQALTALREALARTIGTGIALATVLGLAQLETLNHGAHGTVQNDKSLGKRGGQVLGSGVGGGGVQLAHRPPL